MFMFKQLILFLDETGKDVITYEEFHTEICNNKFKCRNNVKTSFHVADNSLELDLSWDKFESN